MTLMSWPLVQTVTNLLKKTGTICINVKEFSNRYIFTVVLIVLKILHCTALHFNITENIRKKKKNTEMYR